MFLDIIASTLAKLRWTRSLTAVTRAGGADAPQGLRNAAAAVREIARIPCNRTQ